MRLTMLWMAVRVRSIANSTGVLLADAVDAVVAGAGAVVAGAGAVTSAGADNCRWRCRWHMVAGMYIVLCNT